MRIILLPSILLILSMSNSFALSLPSPDESKSVTSEPEADVKTDEIISSVNGDAILKDMKSSTETENIDVSPLDVDSQGHENESERQVRAYGRYGRYGGFYRPYYGGGGFYRPYYATGYYPQYYGGFYGGPYYGGGFYRKPYYGGFYGPRYYGGYYG